MINIDRFLFLFFIFFLDFSVFKEKTHQFSLIFFHLVTMNSSIKFETNYYKFNLKTSRKNFPSRLRHFPIPNFHSISPQKGWNFCSILLAFQSTTHNSIRHVSISMSMKICKLNEKQFFYHVFGYWVFIKSIILFVCFNRNIC